MRSIQRARVAVVAEAGQALLLIARLRWIEAVDVIPPCGAEDARRLCAAGEADICLVVAAGERPDEFPAGPPLAPGREAGVPSLLLAEVVTPYVSRAARQAGYAAAIRVACGPRELYRRIGAALQRRQRARPVSRAIRIRRFAGIRRPIIEAGKPTLH